jgi:hypothetical protein
MIPTSKRPTVEIFYETFSKEEYNPKKFYCIESEFKQTYDVQIKSFESPVKPEPKEFTLTTLKQVGADKRSRTADT